MSAQSTGSVLRSLSSAVPNHLVLPLGRSGPTLRVTINDVRFRSSGRHYLTLSAEGQDARTDVSDSLKAPSFKSRDHSFFVSMNSLSSLGLTVTAHKLMFSKGSKAIGAASISLSHAVVNGVVAECEASLVCLKTRNEIGTVSLTWHVDDRAAAEKAMAEKAAAAAKVEQARAEAERDAAERAAMERAAMYLAEAQQSVHKRAAAAKASTRLEDDQRAAAESMRRTQTLHASEIASRRATEERAASAAMQRREAMMAPAAAEAQHLAADKRAEAMALEQQEAEEARRARRAQAEAQKKEEQERAAMVRRAKEAAAAAEAAARVAEQAAADVSERLSWRDKWEKLLDSRVVLLRPDGARFVLSGRQVVGLSDALRRATTRRAVAFVHEGQRVCLPVDALEALRTRLDARMHEQTLEADLTFEIPAESRANTAPMAGVLGTPEGDAALAARMAVLERISTSAPPRGEPSPRALSQHAAQWLRAHSPRNGVRRAGGNKVAPHRWPAVPEDEGAGVGISGSE